MVFCPICNRRVGEGAFCEHCGAQLSSTASPAMPSSVEIPTEKSDASRVQNPLARVEALISSRLQGIDSHVRTNCDDNTHLRNNRGEPTLEFDQTCVLFEGRSGVVRFRFNPLGGGDLVENVEIKFRNDNSETNHPSIRRAEREIEFTVSFPMLSPGSYSWQVTLKYQSNGRKHQLVGQLPLMVKSVASRDKGPSNINISISNDIKAGGASDVKVNNGGVDGLQSLVVDPDKEMEQIARSTLRDWKLIQFSDDSEVVSLPPMPPEAKVDHIEVTLGRKRIYFHVGGEVTLGRSSDNGIVLHPSEGCDNFTESLFLKMSRHHCFFELSGNRVAVVDGVYSGNGPLKPSTGGTYYDGMKLTRHELNIGDKGILSFGGIGGDAVSMDVQVVCANKACASCPHSDTHWCGKGVRPSLMLTRRDGMAERHVIMWSCFWMGDANENYNGVVIFRKDGAFAYRDGSRSGWLVPGNSISTDFGKATVK